MNVGRQHEEINMHIIVAMLCSSIMAFLTWSAMTFTPPNLGARCMASFTGKTALEKQLWFDSCHAHAFGPV